MTYQIIDCHFHPAVDEETDTNWFYPSGNMQHQIDTLRRAGISRACGAPVKAFTPISFDQIRLLNDKALSLRDDFPDFYIPGIQIHPHFPHESCKEIERCCEGEGVRWVGELVGYMMGYGVEFATNAALEIMDAIKEHKAVVNIHCHDLDVIDKLSESVPDLNIVLAHPGDGKQVFLDRLEKIAKHPNLYLDTSGSGIDRYQILRKVIDVAGRRKLLFGTDYPINNPSVYVHGVLLEPLSEEEYAAIFRDNFLRLTQG
ncbi:MAG: Amidohydro-rel protein [Candidatus Poribacteria bacterium]|nr:Amidohydro-rel protein [Candidatus Poribacteria bacterium]